MNYLTAEHISKTYGDHVALRDLHISIPKQSIFGLLGPNGAGKTSFIRIVTQIIKADGGQILIDSQPLARNHMLNMGYLPEERGLYKKMKVGKLLLYLAELKEVERAEALDRIKVWLKKFDLLPWVDNKVDNLSKGMQQKLQFIASVIHNPSFLILDEPFSGFDPINTDLVIKEIHKLRDNGCTILFSTHRMESVETLCDEIALINNATNVLSGTVSQVKEKYKQNRFEVEYEGEIPQGSENYQVVESKKVDSLINRSTLILNKSFDSNALILELAKANEIKIKNFREVLPSINDIFLSKVGTGRAA